jgi:hypothetical protein
MPALEISVRLVDRGTDWPAWIAAGTGIFTALVVVVSAWIALRGLTDARNTRYGQLIADLSQRWDAPEIHESVTLSRQYGSAGATKFVEVLWSPGVAKRDPEDMKVWLTLSLYPNLIETLGVFASQRIVTESILFRMWGGSIITAWKEWQEPVLKLRELTNDPHVWEYFEGLAGAMERLERDGLPGARRANLLKPFHQRRP